jgi:D-3-phosphoglycerate dehydrogenase
VIEKEGVKAVDSVEELFSGSDIVSLHIPATEQTRGSINHSLMDIMPKGATLVNTARKEVINEHDLIEWLTARTDVQYLADIQPLCHEQLLQLCPDRYFATPKKMGAQTAEANINAGIAAARQIIDYLKNGNERFRLN